MNHFSLRKTTTEFDLKVIELVKARPMLWDTRHVDYKCSERKPLEWQQIAEELGSDAGELKPVLQQYYCHNFCSWHWFWPS